MMISVIIPLYNKEEAIASTIESVLSQDFTDFELVIVNDGSTDKSLEVLSGYNDKRIKIFTKENGGVSSARNFGADMAQSDWLFFLDADDVIERNCLSIFYNLLSDYPEIKFFTSNFCTQDKAGNQLSWCHSRDRGIVKNRFKAVWQHLIFPRMGAMLIEKNIFIEVGKFRKECSVWEDLELVLALMKNNKVAYDPTPVFYHFLEHNTLSQSLLPLKREFAYYIDLNESANIYHKLILLELVVRIRNRRKVALDIEAVNYLNAKLGFNRVILFFGQVERYLLKMARIYFGKKK